MLFRSFELQRIGISVQSFDAAVFVGVEPCSGLAAVLVSCTGVRGEIKYVGSYEFLQIHNRCHFLIAFNRRVMASLCAMRSSFSAIISTVRPIEAMPCGVSR